MCLAVEKKEGEKKMVTGSPFTTLITWNIQQHFLLFILQPACAWCFLL